MPATTRQIRTASLPRTMAVHPPWTPPCSYDTAPIESDRLTIWIINRRHASACVTAQNHCGFCNQILMTHFFNVYTLLFLFILPASLRAGQDSTYVFRASGVCGMCKARIEKAAADAGADKAVWQPSTQELRVTIHPERSTPEQVKKQIAAVGHDVEGLPADDRAYRALPACCQYRDEGNIHHMAGTDHPTHAVTGIVVQENSRGGISPTRGASAVGL